jgi:hypothetical protein
MHPYQVCIINTQGKRVAEHTFRCADDIKAMAKASSLIAAGQTAEVRTTDRLVGVIEGPTPNESNCPAASKHLRARPAT